jgi:hypothetical protein
MEALNNLAMIAIWSGGEALTEAEKHASAITHLWKKEIAAETVPLPAPIEHTVLVMLAERAIGVGDRAEVERVEKALRDLTSRVRGGDREVVSADAERLRLWLRA